jgi:hypothetical protein
MKSHNYSHRNESYMGSIVKVFLILISMTITHVSFGQEFASGNFTWEIDSAVNISNNKGMFYHATIRTFKSDSLHWIQKGGQKKSSFAIVSVEGNWLSQSGEGIRIIHTTLRGNPLKFKFEKSAAGMLLYVDVGQGYNDKMFVRSITSIP